MPTTAKRNDDGTVTVTTESGQQITFSGSAAEGFTNDQLISVIEGGAVLRTDPVSGNLSLISRGTDLDRPFGAVTREVLATGTEILSGDLAGFIRLPSGQVVTSSGLPARVDPVTGQTINPDTGVRFTALTGGATGGGVATQPMTASQIAGAISQTSVRDRFGADIGGTPTAAGADLRAAEFQMFLQSNQAARAQRGQNLEFADFFSRLIGANPVQAANLGALLGFEGGDQFAPIIAQLASGRAPIAFGGLPSSLPINVGGQDFDFPTSITGGQIAQIGNNPALEQIVTELARLGGDRSFLQRNVRARIPAGALPGVQI